MLMTIVKATRQYFSVATEATSEIAFGRDAYELNGGGYYAGLLYNGCLVDDQSGAEGSVYYDRVDWAVFKADELQELGLRSVNLRPFRRKRCD